MVSLLGTLLLIFGFWKYGVASDNIEMYIKPNTTAAIVCPYKGNQNEPVTWKKSRKQIGAGDTLGDGKVKFRISGSYGDGKTILQIINFSARDDDIYRCSAIIGEHILEQFFNIHMCDVPLEMNLFSETDNNALDEHLKNVLCTLDDTDVATTQVGRSTNEEPTNIRGIIQNVTCSFLNMDQCITSTITLQLNLTWMEKEDHNDTVSGREKEDHNHTVSGREKEDHNHTVSGSEKEQPTNNSLYSMSYGNPVSCECGSFLSTNTTKHIFKGFFKKWNLFLKNFESSDYCVCILYVHKCQRQVTGGGHDKIVYFVFVLSTSIAVLCILTVLGVYLILMKRNTVHQINNNDGDNNTANSPAIPQPSYATIQPDVAPSQSTNGNAKPQIIRRTNNSAGIRSHSQHQESSKHKSLEYVDIVFDSTQPSRKFCIRGERNNTPYADIDLTLKADPLPDSESSDSSDDEDIINVLVNQIRL